MTDAAYTFLPWVRRGVAGNVAQADDPGLDPTTASARAGVDVTLNVTTDEAGTTGAPSMTVALYGPGDVTGFDPRQVIRVEPAHQTLGFEPNYFPSVEFDRPDFPWMFTPLAATTKGRLRPWLCLVAVRKRDGVSLESKPGRPLPVLTIDDASKELPNLADSWSWAHVQVAGSYDADGLPKILTEEPELHTARLVCPRKLKEKETYLACVVPTFKVGREAGLGEPVTDSATLEPAWSSETELELPVYYHWEFTTGAAGDFEALARLLQSRRLPPEVGTRPMDVSQPGGGLPSLPAGMKGTTVGLEGALRNPDAGPDLAPWPPSAGFRGDLSPILLAPWTLLAKQSNADPVVSPPIYGQWHAAFGRDSANQPPSLETDAPPWLADLNLDPRNRAASGIGTWVVRDQQEHLMASAWEQVGEIERANQLLRQGQLAREAGTSLYRRHLDALPIEDLVLVAGPVQARVGIDGRTFAGRVRDSRLPQAAVSAPFRRFLRPRGPLARRLGESDGSLGRGLLRGLARGDLSSIPPRTTPAGTTPLEEFRDPRLGDRPVELSAYAEELASLVAREPRERFAIGTEGRPALVPNPDDPETLGDEETGERFQRAAGPHLRRWARLFDLPEPAPKPTFDLNYFGPRLVKEIDPQLTVPRRVLDLLHLPEGLWPRVAQLEPIMTAPEFPQPTYEALRDLSQDLLLPGIDKIPPNTVTVVETNPRFVEAFLVGLNHEMARELLWRGFPTDQRGSYFRQFWDPGGRWPAPNSPEEAKDVPPIDGWEGELGEHVREGSQGGRLVVMIRGELLKRYPNCTIYAQKAKWPDDLPDPFPQGQTPPPREPDGGTDPKTPMFRGTLAPDITFLGFDLGDDEARGVAHPSVDRTKPGWFFVLQQQPTEPRFGLDETGPADPTTLAQLAWTNVETTGHHCLDADDDNLEACYLDAAKTIENLAQGDPRRYAWGTDANAAHAARATLQAPVRIAIHADDMLPPKQEP